MSTSIEWTRNADGTQGKTWNPVTGCTRISEGCRNCYIERTMPFRTIGRRFEGAEMIGSTTGVTLHPDRLEQPLRRRIPTTYFVNSLSDLFHRDVTSPYVARIFAVMALTPRHTFQILTKRPGRMRALLHSGTFRSDVLSAVDDYLGEYPVRPRSVDPMPWPLPNVWIGVSVEDQAAADARIHVLLDTPAAVRFLSCEPLLGPLDIGRELGVEWMDSLRPPGADVSALRGEGGYSHEMFSALRGEVGPNGGLHWVIAGGESGPGARPMHPDWVRDVRDQCVAAGVPFFFKQWGEFVPCVGPLTPKRIHVDSGAGYTTAVERVGKKRAGRELDGRTWDEMPMRAAVSA